VAQVLWLKNKETPLLLFHFLEKAAVSTWALLLIGHFPAQRPVYVPTESSPSLAPIHSVIAFVRGSRTNTKLSHLETARLASAIPEFPAVLDLYHLLFLT